MLPSRLPVTLSRRRERLDGCRQPRLRGWTLALVVALANPLSAGQRVSNELQLKAAQLYRFPEFVEWPARVLEGRPTIDVCVLTPNPFGRVLEQLIEGEVVSGRSGTSMRAPSAPVTCSMCPFVCRREGDSCSALPRLPF